MDVLTDIDLVRAVAPRLTPASLRAADAADDGYLGTLDVRFSVFNNWYEIDSFFEGRFLERIAPGAFRKTMKESRDGIKVLYDHGMDFHVGNKVLGPIRELGEDDDAAYGIVPLFDTSYNRDLLPGLREGVYGSSFRFRVVKDEWNDDPGTSRHNPQGIAERTIKEVRLFEFGPVTFPANPAATAGMRSMTDEFYERLRARNP
ncbi:MAG TPA: HK97 family phage prohead protease, partial [Egibacteraceae bacterium]|nr:HK97 family phage prohead protease [Egibacteraceae bacterium]